MKFEISDDRMPTQDMQEISAKIDAIGTDIRITLDRIDTEILERALLADSDPHGPEAQRLRDADPDRWLTKARDYLQLGLMCARRALTQPTSF